MIVKVKCNHCGFVQYLLKQDEYKCIKCDNIQDYYNRDYHYSEKREVI